MTDSILIIDDNEDMLEFLSVVLGDSYKLYLAVNGEIAQTILDNEVINLLKANKDSVQDT